MLQRKRSRLLALSLVILMVCSSLIGCGGTATPAVTTAAVTTAAATTTAATTAAATTAAETTAAATTAAETTAAATTAAPLPVIDVVFATPYFSNDMIEPNANNEHDPVLKYLGDMFGMNIQVWSGGPGEYHTKLKLQYSSGQGPDSANMLTWDGGDVLYREMETQGALVDIGALVTANPGRYGALERIFQDPFYKIQNQKWNGDANKFESLFNLSSSRGIEGGPAFYMPYLNAVGVTELPKTVNEFIDILRKVKAGDPNGDGVKGDIIPLGLLTYKGVQLNRDVDQMFFQSEGTYMRGFRLDYETGTTYKYYGTDESHIQIFKNLAGYYKEGLIDPEFITRDGWGAWDSMAQGKMAVIATGLPGNPQSPDAYPPLIDNMNQIGIVKGVNISNFKILPQPLTGSNGNFARNYNLSVSTALFNIIPASCKNPERVLDLMNFLYSDKGQEVMWFGIPDVTYIHDSDGKPQLIGDKFRDICTMYTPNDLGAISWDPFLITTDVGRKFCQYERDGWTGGAIKGLNLETTRRVQTPAMKENIKIATDWVDKCYIELPAYFGQVFTEGATKDKEAAISDIENKYFAGFMSGEMDVDKNWPKFVKEITDAGFQTVVDEYNKKLADAKAASGN